MAEGRALFAGDSHVKRKPSIETTEKWLLDLASEIVVAGVSHPSRGKNMFKVSQRLGNNMLHRSAGTCLRLAKDATHVNASYDYVMI